jgi:dihydroxyacetone kinase
MLDAAVCGEIFASPNARQITAGLEAIAAAKYDKGFVWYPVHTLPIADRRNNVQHAGHRQELHR